MSVDYCVRMVYGFELDQDKFIDFVRTKKEKDENFDVYNWMEEISEQSNCEFVYENHYDGVDCLDNAVYFGIAVYNPVVSSTIFELERDRAEEVCDELVRVFGSYNILGSEPDHYPQLFGVGVFD